MPTRNLVLRIGPHTLRPRRLYSGTNSHLIRIRGADVPLRLIWAVVRASVSPRGPTWSQRIWRSASNSSSSTERPDATAENQETASSGSGWLGPGADGEKASSSSSRRTVVRWHRQGFKYYWAWKSRHKGGRPAVAPEVRDLIRRMSRANPLWGAPRIHGELLKLGIDLSQTTVAKYMVRHRKPPSPSWRAFLNNHVKDLVSIDFFTVPTVTFNVLFVFVVLAHDRRRVVHFNVTESPGAKWTAQQTRGSVSLG